MSVRRQGGSGWVGVRALLQACVVLSAGVLGCFGLAPSARGASALVELDVVPVGRGSVTATVREPGPDEPATQTCNGSDYDYLPCYLPFPQGRVVTLIATPDAAGTTFGAWSDPSCPPGPVCTVRVDRTHRQIDALFSPQRFQMEMAAPAGASVTSSPPGILCTAVESGQQGCETYFPLFTKVELAVAGPEPVTWHRCEMVVGTTCHEIVSGCTDSLCEGPLVSIGGAPVVLPSEARVRFHVRSAGSGSGTIRGSGSVAPGLMSGASLDCGRRCSTDLPFGTVVSLVASADRGSRFVRWAEACSSQPTCEFAVGPVTGVTALFTRDAAPSSGSGRPSPKTALPFRFVARLSRLTVRGRGRARAVALRLRTNAAADVWASLTRKHRSFGTRRWRVEKGSRLLRWRVPTRVRRGRYRMSIAVRQVGGTSRGFVRDIRLPR